jgi:hypothetical protein
MTTQASVHVFSYGSNMLTRRLRDRAPSATPIGVGQLNGYTLRWHKRSRKDGSGKCDIVATGVASDCVHGVIFAIDADDKRGLDNAEGLGHGYDEKRVVALVDGVPVTAVAYVATDIDPSLRPYDWYKALVVAGAREHRLPAEYVRALEAVRSVPDPDRTRAAKHLALPPAQ